MNPALIGKSGFKGMFHWFPLHLGKLLFGSYRGIFLYMPILLLSPFGIVNWFRRQRKDSLLWLSISNITLYSFLISSLKFWDGGKSLGARYLIISFLFWFLPIKEIQWNRVIIKVIFILFFLFICL